MHKTLRNLSDLSNFDIRKSLWGFQVSRLQVRLLVYFKNNDNNYTKAETFVVFE